MSVKGVSLAEIKRGSSLPQAPPIEPSLNHIVFFKLPVVKGQMPATAPPAYHGSDETSYHVHMPFSQQNNTTINGEKHSLWALIKQSLKKPIRTSHELQEAILSYNVEFANKWHFINLHQFFEQYPQDAEPFFNTLLPNIIQLALSLPDLIQKPIPLLRKQFTAGSLLANAFLCTFPHRNYGRRDSYYGTFNDINFNNLYTAAGAVCSEKIRCILTYFSRITQNVPVGTLTYQRRYKHEAEMEDWDESKHVLTSLHISSVGCIEDQQGMLQVDFANKYVGGATLGASCVQEEIRFMMSPELILAQLFTQELNDTEALLVTGSQRFSQTKGYGRSFVWTGEYFDITPRDTSGRMLSQVVAIDATPMRSWQQQFTPALLLRELRKAYVGFHNPNLVQGMIPSAVATGNWGCGVFGGDKHLKALLQIMAASEADRSVAYFTFGDKELVDDVGDLHAFLTARHVSVGQLWRLLLQYQTNNDLYIYLRQSAKAEQARPKPSAHQTLHVPFVTRLQNESVQQPTVKASHIPLPKVHEQTVREPQAETTKRSSSRRGSRIPQPVANDRTAARQEAKRSKAETTKRSSSRRGSRIPQPVANDRTAAAQQTQRPKAESSKQRTSSRETNRSRNKSVKQTTTSKETTRPREQSFRQANQSVRQANQSVRQATTSKENQSVRQATTSKENQSVRQATTSKELVLGKAPKRYLHAASGIRVRTRLIRSKSRVATNVGQVQDNAAVVQSQSGAANQGHGLNQRQREAAMALVRKPGESQDGVDEMVYFADSTVTLTTDGERKTEHTSLLDVAYRRVANKYPALPPPDGN